MRLFWNRDRVNPPDARDNLDHLLGRLLTLTLATVEQLGGFPIDTDDPIHRHLLAARAEHVRRRSDFSRNPDSGGAA